MTQLTTRQQRPPTWLRNLIKIMWLGVNRPVFWHGDGGPRPRLSANDICERLRQVIGDDNTPRLRTVQRIIAEFRDLWDVSQKLSEETATTFLGSGWPENDEDTGYLLALIRFWGPEFHPDKWSSPVESVDFPTPTTPPTDANTQPHSDGDNEDEDEDDDRASEQSNPRNILPFSRGEIAVALVLKSSFGWPSDFPEYGGTRIPWALGYEVFNSRLPGELAIIRELALRRSYIEAGVSELEKTERYLSYGDNMDIGSILVDRPWHKDSPWRNSEIPQTTDYASSFLGFYSGPTRVNWPSEALRWNSIYLTGSGEQGHGGLHTLLDLRNLINQYIETSDRRTGARAWEILKDLYPGRDIAGRIQEEIGEPRHWNDLRLAETFMHFGDAHNFHSPVQDPSPETTEVESNTDLDEGGWENLGVWKHSYESTDEMRRLAIDLHSAANELDSERSKRFFQVERNNRNLEDIWLVLDDEELSAINQWINAGSLPSVRTNISDRYVVCSECDRTYIPSYGTIRRIFLIRPTAEHAKLWREKANLRRLFVSIGKAHVETVISHGNLHRLDSELRRLKRFITRLARVAPEEQCESLEDDFQGIIQEAEDAIVALHTRNVTLSPDCLSPLYNRAKFYGNQGEYSKAVGDYTEVLRLASRGHAQAILQGFAFRYRGQAHLDLGQHAEAVHDFGAAIELLPESIDELLNNPDSSILEDPRHMAHEASDESALRLKRLIEESRYGDIFAEMNFRKALAEWDRANTTTSEEYERTASERPPSPPVYASVEPRTPPSIQDSTASGAGTHNVTAADRIREFVIANYIKPAREQGQSSVTVRAGDVAAALQLTNKQPNVCQAMTRSKMRQLANVRVGTIRGPNPGANCFVEYLFPETQGSQYQPGG